MNGEAKALLRGGYDAKRFISDVGLYAHTKIEPGKTLVILDEIQEAPDVLPLMKALAEDVSEHHICAAGSYLGIAYHAGKSFPVGKVELLDMHPMSFLEFMDAMGDESLADVVRALDFDTMNRFADRLERLLRHYYFVGGMPQAVVEFIEGDQDYLAARNVQKNLLNQYDKDFSKHTRESEVERIRLAFDSIPAHLGRENHKFIFGRIEKGARAREYETALQWIVDSGLATRVYRVDKLAVPLKFYRDLAAFKLFMPDVGLLGATMEIAPEDAMLTNKAFSEYKGALTEQYVCQQLSSVGNTPYYWSAGNGGTAEVDFVVSKQGEVVPVEVKAEENLRSKSLRVVYDKTGICGVRVSMSDYREQEWLTNIPLWAVGSYFDTRK